MRALLPPAAMVLACTCWAFGTVGIKALVDDLASTEIAFLRFAASALVLWLIVALTGRLKRVRGAGRAPFIMGICEPFLVSMLLIGGMAYSSATHAVVLWAISPTVAPVMGRVFLGERIGVTIWIGAALALTGAFVLVGGNTLGATSLIGDAMFILSVFVSCLNQVLGRKVATGGGDPMVTSAMQITVAMVLALVAMPAIGGSPLPAMTPGIFVLVISLGVFANGLPFVLYNYALRTVPVARMGLFLPMVAPIGTLLAAVWLAEPVTGNALAALALMLTGAFLPQVTQRRTR